MPDQLETIIQDSVTGQDCVMTIATSTYSGTLVNRDTFDARFSYRREAFEPGASAVAGRMITKEEAPSITVRIMAGLNTTFYGFWKNVYGKNVTGFTMTDFPTFAELAARYGTAAVVEINKSQPGGPGTFDIVIEWGNRSHGYSAA